MLTENNINALLPSTHVSMIYPEGHPYKELWNFQNDEDRKWQDGTKTVFGFPMQNRCEQGYSRDLSTLVEFRQLIMMPLSEVVSA